MANDRRSRGIKEGDDKGNKKKNRRVEGVTNKAERRKEKRE
jgi:hypothetical protein